MSVAGLSGSCQYQTSVQSLYGSRPDNSRLDRKPYLANAADIIPAAVLDENIVIDQNSFARIPTGIRAIENAVCHALHDYAIANRHSDANSQEDA